MADTKSVNFPSPSPEKQKPWDYPLLPFPLDDKNWAAIKTQLNKSGLIAQQINALVPALITTYVAGAILTGTVFLSSGVATVTNSKITGGSKGVVCYTATTVPANSLGTSCSSGSMAIKSSSNTDSAAVNYIIIL